MVMVTVDSFGPFALSVVPEPSALVLGRLLVRARQTAAGQMNPDGASHAPPILLSAASASVATGLQERTNLYMVSPQGKRLAGTLPRAARRPQNGSESRTGCPATRGSEIGRFPKCLATHRYLGLLAACRRSHVGYRAEVGATEASNWSILARVGRFHRRRSRCAGWVAAGCRHAGHPSVDDVPSRRDTSVKSQHQRRKSLGDYDTQTLDNSRAVMVAARFSCRSVENADVISNHPLGDSQRSFSHELFESGLVHMTAVHQVRSNRDDIRFSCRFLILVRRH
jgi:hypothetical protein